MLSTGIRCLSCVLQPPGEQRGRVVHFARNPMPQGRRAKKVIDESKRAQRALAGQRNLLASHALSRLPYGIMRYDVDEISPESALFYYKVIVRACHSV